MYLTRLGILGLGAMNYQPIPKLVEGVKRAVSVAAGGDYTLVLTSASVPPMPFTDTHGLSTDTSRHANTPFKKSNTPSKLSNVTEGNLVIVGGLYTSQKNEYGDPKVMSSTLASSSLDSSDSVDSNDVSDSDNFEDEDGESYSEEEDGENEIDTDDDSIQERLSPQDSKQPGPFNAITPPGSHILSDLRLIFLSVALH